ncbi:MAG: response regulator transcription factor [Mucilaginibacter sp.]
MNTKIRTVIIEDDTILREGYALLIDKTSGFEVVNSYYSYEEAAINISTDMPDVILLDVQLPGTNGIDAIPEIKRTLPGCQVVILSVYEFEDLIIKAYANGASGYLTKDTPLINIIDTLNEIVDGYRPINRSLARVISRLFKKNKYAGISPLETRVLELLTSGKGKNQISRELLIETDMVSCSVSAIHKNFLLNIRAAS